MPASSQGQVLSEQAPGVPPCRWLGPCRDASPTSWRGRGHGYPGPGRRALTVRPSRRGVPSSQILYSLLNQSENTSGWPQVVAEDIVRQVHKLKNEVFVIGGKVRGKTLLPVPEHLGSLDGTSESLERWAAPPGVGSAAGGAEAGRRVQGGGRQGRTDVAGARATPHMRPGPSSTGQAQAPHGHARHTAREGDASFRP